MANHVNPEKKQISNFKSTVLCAPCEFVSETGTVGKPCVSSFAFCPRFRTLFTFWLLFFTKRVDFSSEKHSIQVFDQFLISYSGAGKHRNTRKCDYGLGILATSLNVPQVPTLPNFQEQWIRIAISTNSSALAFVFTKGDVEFGPRYHSKWIHYRFWGWICFHSMD